MIGIARQICLREAERNPAAIPGILTRNEREEFIQIVMRLIDTEDRMFRFLKARAQSEIDLEKQRVLAE